MATFHVVEEGMPHTHAKAWSHTLENAKKHLDFLRNKTGKGYYIVKVEKVFEIEAMDEEELEDECA